MKDLYRILMGEVLKLRRNLAVRLAIFAPIIVVFIIFGGYALGRNVGSGTRVLIGYGQLVLTIWTVVVFPLFAALVAALLASIEHHNETWRHLLALPVRRSTVFVAKWIVGLGLLVFSLIVLAGGVVMTAEILRLLKPSWASASLPTIVVFRGAIVSSFAVVLLFSIQMWVSLRWRSFLPGLVVAIIALAVILVAVPRCFALLGSLFPWSLPAMAMAPHNPYYRIAVWWGLLAGIVLGAIACWRLSTREFC
jgi:lantibiotic transport system permease protein